MLTGCCDAGYRGAHDPLLANWEKREEPFLAYPPADMGLVGWRDPFIFEFKGQGGKEEWGMLLGSGTKGKGGAVLIYRSDTLYGGVHALPSARARQPPSTTCQSWDVIRFACTCKLGIEAVCRQGITDCPIGYDVCACTCAGWRYEGMLCESEVADTGAMWECPLLAQLPVMPEHARPHPMYGGLSGLKTLSNSYNNISAFSPRNGSHPASPLDRKTRAGAAGVAGAREALEPPTMAVPPAMPEAKPVVGFPAEQRRQEPAEERGERGQPPLPQDSGIEAQRAKSLLSEQLLNPYADEADSADGDATMCASSCPFRTSARAALLSWPACMPPCPWACFTWGRGWTSSMLGVLHACVTYPARTTSSTQDPKPPAHVRGGALPLRVQGDRVDGQRPERERAGGGSGGGAGRRHAAAAAAAAAPAAAAAALHTPVLHVAGRAHEPGAVLAGRV